MREVRKRLFMLSVVLCAVVGVTLADEPVRVDARFEPAEVVVGDHLDLVFEVEAERGCEVAFPEINDEFADGYIELLRERDIERVEGAEERVLLRKRYRMIAFEVGEFRFDSLGVLYASEGVIDTAFVDAPINLFVASIPADTTQTTIYDIKPPMETPLMVEEFGGYVVYSLFGLAVLASLVYMFTRLRRREQQEVVILPAEPAHVTAIRALETLHNRKLWQNSKYKEYYTRLSDILREYLDGRYGVSAMEMTTEEILSAIRKLSLSEKHSSMIAALLRESDLVKFAKYIPEEDAPETDYYNVYYFVEETKEAAEEAVDPEERELNDEKNALE